MNFFVRLSVFLELLFRSFYIFFVEFPVSYLVRMTVSLLVSGCLCVFVPNVCFLLDSRCSLTLIHHEA